MADVLKGEMIRGQIDTVILLALTDGDKDSNDIRLAIEEKSDNQYSIKQGTFYSAMQRLVKQGLIKEYRTSALDGIRRKYYSLTPKGTKYLDKNREQWSISKALVDNLIDAEPSKPEAKVEKPIEVVDEFASFKALVEQSTDDNFTLGAETQEDSYFDVLGASVLEDLNAELTKIEATNSPTIEEQEQPLTQIEPEKAEIIEDKSTDFIDDYSSLSNKTKDELFSFEIDDDEFENLIMAEESIEEERVEEEIEDNQTEENLTFNEQLTPLEVEPIDDTLAAEQVETTSLKDKPEEETPIDNPQIERDCVEESQIIVEIQQDFDFIIDEAKVEDTIEETQNNAETQQNFIEEPTKEKPQVTEKSLEEDDLLIVEDFTPTNRNKYKQILNSILPKENKNEVASEPVKKESNLEQVDFESLKAESISTYEEEQERRAQELEQMRRESTERQVEEKVERKQVNTDPSDFSDLYAMANREGFKIRTSHNTNKFAGNGILINRLRKDSALLFFLLIFIEALVLNFALSSILEWNQEVKFIILGCLAIFPAITILMFLLSPKRLVDEVSQFKDAMGVALIITFQMSIIILCIALFASVDFNSFKEVSSFILLPLVLALNIPIYFILKYSLLSTGKYFTE